jgi:hypothetical protein
VVSGTWLWEGRKTTVPRAHIEPPATAARLLGDYGSPLTRPGATRQARIDIAGTIERLRAANINTYAYLVSPGPSQNPALSLSTWNGLPAFAEAAGQANIAVYVYLVPPSGARRAAYKPYGWDYASWAAGVAKVAVDHPSIRGIVLDDLGANTRRRPNVDVVMTPAYLGAVMQGARRIAPWLSLSPVLYVDDVIGPKAVLGAYRSVIDSVWLAYTPPIDSDITEHHALEVSRRVATTVKCPDPLGCVSTRFSGGRESGVNIRTSAASTATARVLDLSVNLSSTDGQPASVVLSVDADGKALAQHPVTAPGWTTVQVELPANAPRSGALSLRVTRKDGASYPVDVLVTTPRLDDKPMEAFLPSDRHVLPLRSVVETQDLPLVAMTYAAPFSKNGPLVTAAQVGRSLDVVGQLMKEGVVDGSMVYLLNLSDRWVGGSDPASFAVVARTYRGWREGTG